MNEFQYIAKALDELRAENREQHNYLTSVLNTIDARVHKNTTGLAVIKSKVAMVGTIAGLLASAAVSIAASFIR